MERWNASRKPELEAQPWDLFVDFETVGVAVVLALATLTCRRFFAHALILLETTKHPP